MNKKRYATIDKKTMASIVCVAIIGLVGCVDQGLGTEQLLYDDGTFEDSTPAQPGTLILNEFNASSEISIVSIQWWLDPTFGWRALLELVILDSQGNIIWSHRINAPQAEWNSFQLREFIYVDPGTFYVGAKWGSPESPLIGVDLSDPDGKSWWVYDGEWHHVTDKDYAFRVTISG